MIPLLRDLYLTQFIQKNQIKSAQIPIKTVKKLLSSYGREIEGGSLEDMAADGEFVFI